MEKAIRLAILALVLVAIIVGSVSYYAHMVLSGTWPPSVENFANAGLFGDSFGILTAVFSGLAFAGIILTVLLQRHELQLQREELTSHHATTRLQNFESTFFQMLRLHNNIVNSIDLTRDNGRQTTGRDCFVVFYTRLTRIYRAKKAKLKNAKTDTEILKLSYDQFWRVHQSELAHYYRYLFNVVRYVDENEFSDGPYMKLLSAQLSDQELLLLFYNCLSKQGTPFRMYVEKYSLFDNMPRIRLLDKSHESRFDMLAFNAVVEREDSEMATASNPA